jgi:phenylpyruvate tautomerase PptA (4-oxalocrotonate tautomerase family)
MNRNDLSKQPSQATNEVGEVSRRTALLAASIGAVAVSGGRGLAADAGSAGFGAPFVEMSFPVGVLSVEQKAALIKRVTDVINAAMDFPSDSQRRLFVEILETPEGGFGVNGQVVGPRPRQ